MFAPSNQSLVEKRVKKRLLLKYSMEVVYERTIELYNKFSPKIIKNELQKRFTESMLTEILMPLSCEEIRLDDMFGELIEKNLIGENAPTTDRNINID